MTSEVRGGSAAGLRRGWCPTGTMPMAAEDGLLLRVRLSGGRLEAAALRRLARICREHGNGAVVVTRRGKLEFRGIADGAAAVAALRDAGLVPLDERDAAMPDCIESPASDLDRTALASVRPVGRRLEQALRAWGGGDELPAKFALVLDGGGRAHVGDTAGDLRFDAIGGGTYRVALAGTCASAVPLGQCVEEDVPEVATALLQCFQHLRKGREDRIRRVAHALAAGCRDEFHSAADRWLTPVTRAPERCSEAPVLGHWPGIWYGVAFAFGRMDAQTLEALADTSEGHGDGDVRILPSRTLLLSRASADAGAALRAAGAIDVADDPRLRIQTCSGLGGCSRATTRTLDDARAFADRAPALLSAGGGCVLHVSGCAKGCAHSGPAPVTLTAREGRYDLSLNDGPGGRPLWRGLDPAAAGSRLAALERIAEKERAEGESILAALARLDLVQLQDSEEVDGA